MERQNRLGRLAIDELTQTRRELRKANKARLEQMVESIQTQQDLHAELRAVRKELAKAQALLKEQEGHE